MTRLGIVILVLLPLCAGCGLMTSTRTKDLAAPAPPERSTDPLFEDLAPYDYITPFRIELNYGGQVELAIDSQRHEIRTRRTSLSDLGVPNRLGEVVYIYRLTDAQHIGLARWTARFVRSDHPVEYPSRGPDGWAGCSPSWVRVNEHLVVWDNTSDAPELRAQIERLLDLTEGRHTIASHFKD
jgi:hypothetical protein